MRVTTATSMPIFTQPSFTWHSLVPQDRALSSSIRRYIETNYDIPRMSKEESRIHVMLNKMDDISLLSYGNIAAQFEQLLEIYDIPEIRQAIVHHVLALLYLRMALYHEDEGKTKWVKELVSKAEQQLKLGLALVAEYGDIKRMFEHDLDVLQSKTPTVRLPSIR